MVPTAALLFGGGYVLVGWAEQQVPSGPAALLNATTPAWVVFFDGGRGWALSESEARGATDTEMLYDAGLGVVLGDVGIYGAVPFSGPDRAMRFFIRFGPRF